MLHNKSNWLSSIFLPFYKKCNKNLHSHTRTHVYKSTTEVIQLRNSKRNPVPPYHPNRTGYDRRKIYREIEFLDRQTRASLTNNCLVKTEDQGKTENQNRLWTRGQVSYLRFLGRRSRSRELTTNRGRSLVENNPLTKVNRLVRFG